jgi:hypothetical protein
VVGFADLAVGLLGRDLLPGPGHLDGHCDRADHRRGNDDIDHEVHDDADDRSDHEKSDQYADPDGGDLEPAHPPHPPSDELCPSRDITRLPC